MLRHKRNIKAKAKAKHVKLTGITDAAQHLQQQQQQQQEQEQQQQVKPFRVYVSPVQALRQRLEFNQQLNQRPTLCLELYHKNIIKKLSELNKINVYKLTKNVCQT